MGSPTKWEVEMKESTNWMIKQITQNNSWQNENKLKIPSAQKSVSSKTYALVKKRKPRHSQMEEN
jgi:hypothetical protein